MSRLLAAIRSSPAARPVCSMAVAAAPVLGATVDCVHIVEDGGDQTAQSTAATVGVPFRTVDGDPVDRLTAMLAEPDVLGVVVGTRDSAVGSRRVGHLPYALASVTDKPVLVVPPTSRPPAHLSRVLVAMKGTPRHAVALRRAVDLAAAQDLEIVVVHVDDASTIPAFNDQVQHETEAYTAEFFARFLPGARHARLECRVGDVVGEILAVADAAAAEILAIGWSHVGEPLVGDVGGELLERSPIPVMLVGTVDS